MDNLKTPQLSTEQQAFIITPYLTAYFDRMDRARRFTQPGFMTRELTSYYHARHRKIVQELTTEAVKVGMLKGIRKQIKKLLKRAESLQGEELRKVGTQIETLYKQADELT